MNTDQWPSLVLATLEQFVATLAGVLPRLLAALTLLLIGYLVARLIRSAVLRISRDLDRLLGRLFGQRLSRGLLKLPWPVSRILATTAFWLVLLFFVTATAEILGFPGMADWIGRMASYLPVVLAAAGIVVFGIVAAALAREAIAALPLREAALLARATWLLIVTVAVIIGIDQLGVEVTLLANVVTIAAAALLGSIALAFGLGARTTVGNLIAAQYVRNAYAVGQRVRIGEVEGVIIELLPTAVVIDSAGGRVMVPCSEFESRSSTLLVEPEAADA